MNEVLLAASDQQHSTKASLLDARKPADPDNLEPLLLKLATDFNCTSSYFSNLLSTNLILTI